MSERRNAGSGLLDGMTASLGGPRTAALLERLEAAIDWERLAAPIRTLPEYNNPGAGRRPWSAMVMLRATMLAKWFNLSDPQLEECLKDRLSFRRFVGLSLTDDTPDDTTFVRFRARLREAGLHQTLFHDVIAQLDERGLLVREGTAVDATIIEQSRGVRPGDGGSRDGEASFTQKHGRTSFGYKGHIACDGSGVVTGWRFTTAREHDGASLDALTEHENLAVYADAVYDSRARRERLRARGVIDAIIYQRRRGQDILYDWQSRWNALVAPRRAVVEHPFAELKQRMGLRRVRYRGLARNAMDFALSLVAANIRRSLSLAQT
jgi:transposase, IS5 family